MQISGEIPTEPNSAVERTTRTDDCHHRTVLQLARQIAYPVDHRLRESGRVIQMILQR
jgi:hypothetical protein